MSRFEINCQALECMDVDCTEVHKAIKDVKDAVGMLDRVAAENQLAFLSQDSAPDDERKQYSLVLRR